MSQILNYLRPTEKTIGEKCKDYIWERPSLVYKGVPAAIAAWYCVPTLVTGIVWLPWLYVGHQVYKGYQQKRQAESWWRWLKGGGS